MSKKVPFIKRLGYIILIFFLACLLVEAFNHIFYITVNHRLFSIDHYRKQIETALIAENPSDSKTIPGITNTWQFVEVIHPYLGFVMDPNRNDKSLNISDYGFMGKTEPVFSRKKNELVIGIFGGSFAQLTGLISKDRLIEKLEPLNKNVTILIFSLGGYKQPQQLITLSYLLSLGTVFDVVVNIDGFNEIALPPVDNLKKNVNPFYPRIWKYRVAGIKTPTLNKMLARLFVLKQERVKWSNVYNRFGLYRSISLCIIWDAKLLALEKERTKILLAIKHYKSDKLADYIITGPEYSFTEGQEMFDDLAHHWMRSSIQMKNLCEANNIAYYHFLQPNQYVKGSKPMGKEEMSVAIQDDFIYKPFVMPGYSSLRKFSVELIDQDVNFKDLTMIYSNIEEPLYVDACCHTNKKGFDIVADIISETILKDFLL